MNSEKNYWKVNKIYYIILNVYRLISFTNVKKSLRNAKKWKITLKIALKNHIKSHVGLNLLKVWNRITFTDIKKPGGKI